MALKLNLVVEKPDVSDEFEYIEEQADRNAESSLLLLLIIEFFLQWQFLFPLLNLQ